ncbi:hypothetical protein GWO43_03020 [candidate division KSB1 bacterium]|nr:hypothetical protein [candidate division KSB1 bacterium]NIR69997.1 hypothetical protein [candidate division KSB1 bacterium]NIS23020.1 hypothetical protein [candidate division KSB1 bacterium]NIT69878.1 hypothetical protein [candidate division KSB1 bacterium]NIU23527.1 hypothetical protein [candidate division KSB1 bacterium]
MRRHTSFVLVLTFLVSFFSLLNGQIPERERDPISLREIVELTHAGVEDDVIISQIQATGAYFELSSDDILFLKDMGVKDKVIKAMIDTAQERSERRQIRVYRARQHRTRYYTRDYHHRPSYYHRPYHGFRFGFGIGFGHGHHRIHGTHGHHSRPHFSGRSHSFHRSGGHRSGIRSFSRRSFRRSR